MSSRLKCALCANVSYNTWTIYSASCTIIAALLGLLQQWCYCHYGRHYCLLQFVLYFCRADLDCSVRVVDGVSICVCDEAIREWSRTQLLQRGPGGSVKAARQYTIALQQGDGDRKTSIREASMDAKWLGPISLGSVQSQERHLWSKETNDDRERGVATQQEEDSGSQKAI